MMMRSQRRHRARLVEGLDRRGPGEPARPPTTRPSIDRADAAAARRASATRACGAALDELPTEYRDVVALHYHQDLGLQEIARRLATTESAVRSRLHRARSRLRAILDKTETTAAA